MLDNLRKMAVRLSKIFRIHPYVSFLILYEDLLRRV